MEFKNRQPVCKALLQQAFTQWLVDIADQTDRGDTSAVLRSIICEINSEYFLHELPQDDLNWELGLGNKYYC